MVRRLSLAPDIEQEAAEHFRPTAPPKRDLSFSVGAAGLVLAIIIAVVGVVAHFNNQDANMRVLQTEYNGKFKAALDRIDRQNESIETIVSLNKTSFSEALRVSDRKFDRIHTEIKNLAGEIRDIAERNTRRFDIILDRLPKK